MMMLLQVLVMAMVVVNLPAGVRAMAPAAVCDQDANPFINNNNGAMNICAGLGQVVNVQGSMNVNGTVRENGTSITEAQTAREAILLGMIQELNTSLYETKVRAASFSSIVYLLQVNMVVQHGHH